MSHPWGLHIHMKDAKRSRRDSDRRRCSQGTGRAGQTEPAQLAPRPASNHGWGWENHLPCAACPLGRAGETGSPSAQHHTLLEKPSGLGQGHRDTFLFDSCYWLLNMCLASLHSHAQNEQPNPQHGTWHSSRAHQKPLGEGPLHPADILCGQVDSEDSPCSLLHKPHLVLGCHSPLPSSSPHPQPSHGSGPLRHPWAAPRHAHTELNNSIDALLICKDRGN